MAAWLAWLLVLATQLKNSSIYCGMNLFSFFFFSDGKISLQEMISAVQRLKDAPSEAKCQRIAEMLDEDHDGALDLVDVGTVSKNC